MTVLNSQVQMYDFKHTFKSQIKDFEKYGYADLNNDALWKWSSILYAIAELQIAGRWDVCIDIGGGESPLTKIISNYCRIINVDKYRGGNWFPLNENGEYIKSTGLPGNPKNIEYVNQDFVEWARTLEDNSVDFMFDSCSVIHFDNKSTIALNDGCQKTIEQVERVLKPGGYFIVASDILHPIHKDTISVEDNKGEFLYFEKLLKLYTQGDMKPYGDMDLNLFDTFYSNILQIDPSLPNYIKMNHRYYQDMKDWQTFCHFEGSCQQNLTIGRYVFKKVS